MSRNSIILASLILAGTSSLALADGDSWRQRRIDATQAQEAREIEQGRYQGELNRREYRGLLAEQERIKQLERTAKADGHISKREFREIRDAQASAERHIQAESHDGQKSWWRRFLYQNRY